MILLLTVECTQKHIICGTPYEYVSERATVDGMPPDEWTEEQSILFYSRLAKNPERWHCPECNEPINDSSAIVTRLMVALTMPEAMADLATLALG